MDMVYTQYLLVNRLHSNNIYICKGMSARILTQVYISPHTDTQAHTNARVMTKGAIKRRRMNMKKKENEANERRISGGGRGEEDKGRRSGEKEEA